MLGLFNQGPYFTYKKQLSKLLVVSKSHEKSWWDGCYTYVVPSSARELPAGSCGCILNDGAGQVGLRIMSNHPKAQHCSCASGWQ